MDRNQINSGVASTVGEEIMKHNSVNQPSANQDTANPGRRVASEDADYIQTDDATNLGAQEQDTSERHEDNETQEQPRRYDEADPNWREPDVQMQNESTNTNVDAAPGSLS